MSVRKLVCIVVLCGCSRTIAAYVAQAQHTAPVTPVVTAPSAVVSLSTGLSAEIAAPLSGLTYDWVLSNATLTSPSRGTSITFTAGAAGVVVFTVQVANDLGATASPATSASQIVSGPPDGYQPRIIAPTRIIAGRASVHAQLANPIASVSYIWSVSGDGQLDTSTQTSASFSAQHAGVLTLQVAASVPGAAGATKSSAHLDVEVDPIPLFGINLIAGALGGIGFLDGPVSQALFPAVTTAGNDLLVQADGTVWESDVERCVLRAINGGSVTSVGMPYDCRAADGDAKGARLQHPTHLASASGDGVWFLDNLVDVYGNTTSVGLRRAGRDGRVSTYGSVPPASADVNDPTTNCASIDADGLPLPIESAVFCNGLRQIATLSNGDLYVASGSGTTAYLRRYPSDGSAAEWLFALSSGCTDSTFVSGTSLAAGPAVAPGIASLTTDGANLFMFGQSGGIFRYDPQPDALGHRALAIWPAQSSCLCSFNGEFASASLITPDGALFDMSSTGGFVDGYDPSVLATATCSGLTVPQRLAGGGVFPFALTGYKDGPGLTAKLNAEQHLHSVHMDLLASSFGASAAPAIYVADIVNHAVRKIAPLDASAIVSTVAGGPGGSGNSDGPGALARFNAPTAVVVDFDGTAYVADSGNGSLRRVALDGTVSTLFGTGSAAVRDGGSHLAAIDNVTSLVMLEGGDLLFADGPQLRRYGRATAEVTTVLGQATVGFQDGANGHALLQTPLALAARADGTVAIVDTLNHALRLFTESNELLTLAGGSAGQLNDGFSSTFQNPQGIAVAPDGVMFVSDSGNHQVRSVALVGGVLTVALVAGDASGGGGAANACDLVDGPCASAHFRQPTSLAVQANGDVLVVDTWDSACGSEKIRRAPVMRLIQHPQSPESCYVATIAGNPDPRFQGVALKPFPASFDTPTSLALGPLGDLWFVDTAENSVLTLDLGN